MRYTEIKRVCLFLIEELGLSRTIFILVNTVLYYLFSFKKCPSIGIEIKTPKSQLRKRFMLLIPAIKYILYNCKSVVAHKMIVDIIYIGKTFQNNFKQLNGLTSIDDFTKSYVHFKNSYAEICFGTISNGILEVHINRCYIIEIMKEFGLYEIGNLICDSQYCNIKDCHPKISYELVQSISNGEKSCVEKFYWNTINTN